MDLTLRVGLPLLVMLAMVVVGLDLTLADLRRVLHYPQHVAFAMLGQLLVLPAIAIALVALLHPPPAIAGGMLLTAAAPQATMSNFFCMLARADIALSVTLTAVSSILAVVSAPLVASLSFRLLLGEHAEFALPPVKVMQQVVTGLLLPVAIGMLLRHHACGFVARHRDRLRMLSLFAVALLLGVIAVDQARTIEGNLVAIVTLAALFTVLAAALGFGLARGLAWPYADVVTMMSAFPARSLSMATLVAVNVLGRLEFLSFAVVFFIVQGALLAPVMLWARSRSPQPAGDQAAARPSN